MRLRDGARAWYHAGMRTPLFLTAASAALSAPAEVAGPATLSLQDGVMRACLVALAAIACACALAGVRQAGRRVRARPIDFASLTFPVSA